MKLFGSLRANIYNQNSRAKEGGEKKASKRVTVLNVIGIIICIFLIPILIVDGTLLVKSVKNPDVPPDFAGYYPVVIGDYSMHPVFGKKDLVIFKETDTPDALEEGTIICFRGGTNNKGIITRQIVGTETNSEGGVMYVVAQGERMRYEVDAARVSPGQIIGVMNTVVEDVGGFVLFMQTPAGIACFVALPLAVLLFTYFILDKMRYRKLLAEMAEKQSQQLETGAQQPDTGADAETPS